MTGQFVHLHTHSYFSLLDGAASPEALVQRAAELGMPALALTDHDALFGVVRFYEAAKQAGIHPIVGLELAVGPGGHHVTLLAASDEGYRNLCRLSTEAMTEAGHVSGAGGTERTVPRERLWEAGDGLIVLSGCRRGLIPSLLAAGRDEEAKQAAVDFRKRFGAGNFYIELQHHGVAGHDDVNRRLVQLADEIGIGVVATNNVHYLTRDDAAAHDALLALGAGAKLVDANRPRFPSAEYFMKSPEDMQALFAHRPDALQNTLRIAERCHVDLQLGKMRLPKLAEDAPLQLAQRVYTGARRRFGDALPHPVTERLEHELGVIAASGLSDYFLLVADIVARARQLDIRVGPGRGSAAGSLVAYCLSITDVDPLKYGLVFERFLNPQRLQMPDIDVDVCDTRRDELLADVRNYFGTERVAHIAAFGTLAARAAVRDMGRVLGVSAAKVDELARLVPNEPNVTLTDAVQQVAALRRLSADDAEAARLLALAQAVEGTPRHLSTHAAGIVIGDGPLLGELPLVKTADGTVITQFPMEDVAALGYVKIDLLGLRTLTVIDNARNMVAGQGGSIPDLLPQDDPRVYEAIGRFGAEGIFQLETPMFQRLVERMRPERFEDFAALLALGRPGPGERVDEFVRRRRGQSPVHYHHPVLAPILEETYGIIVYQEQVMRIAVDVAGYSPAEADLFRRAMSAKDPVTLQAQRERFVAGAAANGIPESVAQRIFAEIATFAGYGFNKSHSVAYALLSYETAYLRTYHPAAFFAALLSSWRGNPQRIARYIAAARRMGVRVLAPDVNTSPADFAVQDGAIAFGLTGLRHVGEAAAEAIVAARQDGPFKSLMDLVQRLPGRHGHRRLFQSLIEAGACDSFGLSRADMLRQLGDGSPGSPAGDAVGQTSLFGDSRANPDISDTIGGSGPLIIEMTADAAAYFPALQRLLKAHPGPVPVLLKIAAGGRIVTVQPDAVTVAPTNELLDKLKREIARGRIRGVARG